VRLILVTAPTMEPVTLVEARLQCRVDAVGSPAASALDALLERYVSAAVAHLDGPFGYIGRALVTQTWDLKLDSFPAEIVIPMPPLQSVDSLSYIDPDGETVTLSAESPLIYQIVTDTRRRARIVPAYGESWPTARDVPDAVTVRFTCGWRHDDSPQEPVPESIRNALLLMVEDLFDGKESRRAAWQALLAPYRIYE